MATAVFTTTENTAISRVDTDVDDRHGWGFVLLLATTATLFLRPADLIPAIDAWPIYQVLIVACIGVSARAFLRQFRNANLIERPVNACLLVLLASVGASHLSHGFVWGARHSMLEVGKLLALFFLIIGLVNTPIRLRFFMKWISLAITFIASLAILDHFGYVSISALEPIQDHSAIQQGLTTQIERIRGTGIFKDPNDFGLILVTGLVFCTSFVCRPFAGWPRWVWLLPVSILMYALALTHSRGAFLSLVAAFPAAMCYFRGRRFVVLAPLVMPILLLAFSARMTDVSAVKQGTGQDRLQIWSESLNIWRQNPIFGLGEGLIADEIGMVTHNSFLHCFAELGALGGTSFLACFLAVGLGLWLQRTPPPNLLGETRLTKREILDCRSQRGFLFAALVASAVAMLTISRQFVAPTYLILGIASAAQSMPASRDLCAPSKTLRIGNRFLILSMVTSALSLLAFYLTIRIFVHW